MLHLIDSLSPGGAERVAVNLFNAQNRVESNAWLCATRAGGLLEEAIEKPDRYLFLGKNSAYDAMAFFRLIRFTRKNRINLVHAHSSSVFWGTALKWFTGAKLLWHDHYGNSELLDARPVRMLKFLSKWFDTVCSVNHLLLKWSIKHLKINPSSAFQLNHFAVLPEVVSHEMKEAGSINILCLANLRPQKDHPTLLKAFSKAQQQLRSHHLNLWLVGEYRHDDYYSTLCKIVKDLGLTGQVHFTGAQANVTNWLGSADLAVLSSRSEGLPVALMEYGLAGLPVVATDVGACRQLLDEGEAGLLIPSSDPEALAEAIVQLVPAPDTRRRLGAALKSHIDRNYSESAVLTRLQEIYHLCFNTR